MMRRMMREAPAVRIMRQSFYRSDTGGSSATWTEHLPPLPLPSGARRSSPFDVDERPAGEPTDVRQEVRLSWPGCSIALEDGISQPWVTFRRSGDAEEFHMRRTIGVADGEGENDHAFFIFDGSQPSAKIEVASARLGVTGVLMTSVFVGNQIDASRLSGGLWPSSVVDLARIAKDQVWIHGAPWIDAMRTVESIEEASALSRAMQLAGELRRHTAPQVGDVGLPMRAIQRLIEGDPVALALASSLRQLLEPFALDAEHTELFARAQEMYAQEVGNRPRPRGDALPGRPRA